MTIRLFAGLRDLAGRKDITVSIDQPLRLSELITRISPDVPHLDVWIKKKAVLFAVNHEEASEDSTVRNGDEVALMPPFSGGAAVGSGAWVRIQEADFSVEEEIDRVKAASRRIGGIAVFLGTARDFSKGRTVDHLEYNHYAGMAEKVLSQIRKTAIEKFGIIELSIIHRRGEIRIGGNIVLIVAGAEHREEAFDACRWCIDELKATAPIWKKEITPEGEFWVDDCA